MSIAAPAELKQRGFHAKHHPAPRPWVNVSFGERIASGVLGGVLILGGLRRGGVRGLTRAVIGADLVYRGVSGHCSLYQLLGVNTAMRHNRAIGVRAGHGTRAIKSITVNRPAADLYRFLRQPENWPQMMPLLESVQQLDETHARFTIRAPLGRTFEWDVEIFNERENELLAWRSLPGSLVDEAGAIRLREEPGRGTVVTAEVKYDPPGGKLTDALADLFDEGIDGLLTQDLRRFKQLMEAGEIARSQPQPSGRHLCRLEKEQR
jgi:uncharacterized membrane protein